MRVQHPKGAYSLPLYERRHRPIAASQKNGTALKLEGRCLRLWRSDKPTERDRLNPSARSGLTAHYLAQREALARFLRARTGSSAEIEDLLQDIYLRVAATDDSVEIHNPVAYLYRLASNLLVDRARSRRDAAARDAAWRRLNQVPGQMEDIADAPSAEDVVAGRQRLDALLKALATLPPKTQRIFRMHKFDGLGYAAVAEEMQISRSSVEKHMMEALRVLAGRVGR